MQCGMEASRPTKRRPSQQHRCVVDQWAALLLLQATNNVFHVSTFVTTTCEPPLSYVTFLASHLVIISSSQKKKKIVIISSSQKKIVIISSSQKKKIVIISGQIEIWIYRTGHREHLNKPVREVTGEYWQQRLSVDCPMEYISGQLCFHSSTLTATEHISRTWRIWRNYRWNDISSRQFVEAGITFRIQIEYNRISH